MLRAPGRSDGETGTKILLEAMSKDKVHLARFILDALDGEIVDHKTEGAQTPLISSVLLPDGQARCKFVELLLQRGARVNCQDGDGRTALSYACEKGCLDTVKILVRNNADPEIVDSWGNTALMYAAVAGHSHVVEFLVRAFKRLGLQIDRQNKVGNSAVEVAKFLGHTECFFALTNNIKKGRETEGGAQRNAHSQERADDTTDKFESKVGSLVKKLEVLQAYNHGDNQLVQDRTWKPRPAGQKKTSRLPSMDSIEEFEREHDSSPSPPQELVFSGVLTPKPPPRTTVHREKLTATADHLPPLIQGSETHKSVFFSPRPGRNAPNPCATSALGILLTPIPANKGENESEREKTKILDFSIRRFHDSYYQKRCSLPTSILSPTPPERTLVSLRKSKTVKVRTVSPIKDENFQFSAPASSTSFSALSSKLLRRFTAPEFKKDARELEKDPPVAPRRIPRSETFPQTTKHPQVDSKPSIDSISAVKCEFDFNLRTPLS